jgi:tryptophan halogenase
MEIPESLSRRMKLFSDTGKVFREQDELFTELGWQQVMIGQGMIPDDYHPIVDALDEDQLFEFLDNVKRIISTAASSLPSHEAYLEKHCRAR